MIRNFYWNGEDFIEYDRIAEKAKRAHAKGGVTIIRDTPAYKSPLGDGVIEGRAARREHFKRTGTREVDPSEYRPVYHSEKRAIANGGVYQPREDVALEEGVFQRGIE